MDAITDTVCVNALKNNNEWDLVKTLISIVFILQFPFNF